MMGYQSKKHQLKLFYSTINLENRIRGDHILRKIKENIDFIYKIVESKCSQFL